MDKIKADDDKYTYRQIEEYELIQADKKIISDWIEFYLHNGPELEPLKKYRLQQIFTKMQNQLEDLLWKFNDEIGGV